MKSTLETVKENKISKILGWIGIIVGVLGILATFYFEVLRRDEPRLEYDIVSATDFFNNSESAPYIKVFIEDSIDVQENHYNITAYNIKVENKGSKHIRYNDYDQGLFGLNIENGTLMEVPLLLSASNESIKKNYSFDTITKGSSKIEIPKLSLDVDDNYVIKIVLLHNVDSIPLFIPEGKIVGQKEIIINKFQTTNLTFWAETFGGNWLIQVVRLLSYCLVGFWVMLGIDFLIEKIDDKKRKQKNELYEKQKEIDKQQKELNEKKNREDEIKELNTQIIPSIKEEYINNGRYGRLYDLHHIFCFNDESEITDRYRKMPQFIMRGKNKINEEEFNRIKKEFDNYNYYIEKHYFILDSKNLSITFDNDTKKSISLLFDFLYEKGRKENPYKSIDDILNTPV